MVFKVAVYFSFSKFFEGKMNKNEISGRNHDYVHEGGGNRRPHVLQSGQFPFFSNFLVANILFPFKEMKGKDLGFVQNFATKIDQSC